MKPRHILSLLSSLFTLLPSWNCAASCYAGRWEGKVGQLPIVINLSGPDDSLKATLSSPSQSAYDIPATEVKWAPGGITISFAPMSATFAGSMMPEGNAINGVWTQGMIYPLKLLRVKELPVSDSKVGEEVTFAGGNGNMAGTLLSPSGATTAIVMVTGSGAQNRDEELYGHKPFAVIADSLYMHGLATLRYDDRGMGQSAPGTAKDTSLDFADDAMGAVNFLKSKGYERIGILGHSEGGTIAVICGAKHPEDVDFIISLAGMGVTGKELLVRQNEMLMGGENETIRQIFDLLAQDDWNKAKEAQVRDLLATLPGMTTQAANQQIAALTSPWYLAFVKLNPASYIKDVKCPILAINGTDDTQVESHSNLAAFKVNPKTTEVELDGFNHLMQKGTADYSAPVPTPHPEVIGIIAEWIKKL